MEARTSKPKRRRRAPAEAEAEILTAAHAVLRDRPFQDFTVDEIMRRTELSRPSFYVYFGDRYQLVLRIVETISEEFFAVAERWFAGAGDPVQSLRDALDGTLAVWSEHAAELRALAHAAAENPEVRASRDVLRNAFVDAVATHLERAIDAGEVAPLNARETARALILMNEAYFLERVEPAGNGTDRQDIVDTLLTVWVRTLYGSRTDD